MSLYRTGGGGRTRSQCTRGSGVAHKRNAHVSDRPTQRGTDSCSGDRDLRTDAVVERCPWRQERTVGSARLIPNKTRTVMWRHARAFSVDHNRPPSKTHDASRWLLTTPGGRTKASEWTELDGHSAGRYGRRSIENSLPLLADPAPAYRWLSVSSSRCLSE